MPGIHKNPTIAFRVDSWQRDLINMRADLSGIPKKDFIARSCIYANIVVTGTKNNIDRIVDEVKCLRSSMLCIAGQLMSGNFRVRDDSYREFRSDLIALAVAVVDILDGAAYLYGKEGGYQNDRWKDTDQMNQYMDLLQSKVIEHLHT